MRLVVMRKGSDIWKKLPVPQISDTSPVSYHDLLEKRKRKTSKLGYETLRAIMTDARSRATL
jgi:hypothetical protein